MTRRLATAILGLTMMATGTASGESRGITKQVWGKTKAGEPVDLYTLTNAKGASIKVATLGGTIVSINVPDKAGKLGDVVLGFDTLDGYLGSHPFFGVLVGRYGNRIGKGTFTLDGKTYTLAKNNGENSLHGGVKGFDKYVWKTREVVAPDGLALELTHVSPDGDEGYPGQAVGDGPLHVDRRQRAAHRLHGDDRQADGAEPDQPRVLQSGRSGDADHPDASR